MNPPYTDFYSRFESLCAEEGIRPQSAKAIEIAATSPGTISYWCKNREALPNTEILARLAKYFRTSIDYLVGLSEDRKNTNSISAEELLLIEAYNKADAYHKFAIVSACMEALKAADFKQDKVG